MLVARFNPGGAKAALEQPPHRRNKRGAARQEHPVTLSGTDRGLLERLVEGALDTIEIVLDPAFERTARHRGLDPRARHRKFERSLLDARQCLLGLRDRAIERIALLALDQRDELLEPLGVEAEPHQLL